MPENTDHRDVRYWAVMIYKLLSGAITGGLMHITGTITGTVTAIVAPATQLINGQTTVATANTHGVLGNGLLASGVRVKALHANTGWIYVGQDGVTATTGYVLDAGEDVFLEVDNLADVYICPSVNGEGVSYIGS